LRSSLVARGYEYAERNGWKQKKKEYLDLIDFLSTERFDGLQHSSGAAPAAPRKIQQKPGADNLIQDAGGRTVPPDDPSLAVVEEQVPAKTHSAAKS
jgi:hypothetical protein